MTKKFSLLQLFSLVDGRLSTNMDDIYDMLNHICDDNLFTHQLPVAMNYLKSKNPKWFQEISQCISEIKKSLNTDDFNTLIKFIEEENEYFDIPQLKDEVDVSNLGDFVFENSLIIPKSVKRKAKLEKINNTI